MDPRNFAEIERLESGNWWYRGRRDLLGALLRRAGRRFKSALDVGCGTGANLSALRPFADKVSGLDPDAAALRIASGKGYDSLLAASLTDLAAAAPHDLVVCLDVLEHLDDRKAVESLARCLEPGGLLILTVPAHRYLWNDNDAFSHHLRRYEREELRALLQDGFSVERLSYWNFSAFLPAYALFRWLRGRRISPPERQTNNLNLIPRRLDRLLYGVVWMENRLLERVDLPQGTSIVCVARKGAAAAA